MMVLVNLCQNVFYTNIFNQAEKGSNSIKDEKLKKKKFENRVLILALVYNHAVRFFAILPPGGDTCVGPGQADNSEPVLT